MMSLNSVALVLQRMALEFSPCTGATCSPFSLEELEEING
jgi:hypothetical protein